MATARPFQKPNPNYNPQYRGGSTAENPANLIINDFKGTAVPGSRDPNAKRSGGPRPNNLTTGAFPGGGNGQTLDTTNPAGSGVLNNMFPTTRTDTKSPADVLTTANKGGGDGGPAVPDPTGTESGPGILEDWFNQRANGTDPAYEYALGRGTQNINDQFSARGGYNSSAALNKISDYGANLSSQRMAQLDALAGGASGEHRDRLSQMFDTQLKTSAGKAGLAGAYDISAGNIENQSNMAAIQLMLDKAGVDSKTSQGILDFLMNLGKIGAAA